MFRQKYAPVGIELKFLGFGDQFAVNHLFGGIETVEPGTDLRQLLLPLRHWVDNQTILKVVFSDKMSADRTAAICGGIRPAERVCFGIQTCRELTYKTHFYAC